MVIRNTSLVYIIYLMTSPIIKYKSSIQFRTVTKTIFIMLMINIISTICFWYDSSFIICYITMVIRNLCLVYIIYLVTSSNNKIEEVDSKFRTLIKSIFIIIMIFIIDNKVKSNNSSFIVCYITMVIRNLCLVYIIYLCELLY